MSFCRHGPPLRRLNPELDITVLTGDPADSRIEAPAPEQPRRDACFPRYGNDPADNTQLSSSLLVHSLILRPESTQFRRDAVDHIPVSRK
jgi:hypothetical protein